MSRATPKIFHWDKSFVFDPVDYAEFCQRAIPPAERLSITAKRWPATERNCRRAYRAVRSILVTKDYLAAARASLPMFRQFKTLPPTLVNVLNFVSQEIYDPGWIKTLDDKALSE